MQAVKTIHRQQLIPLVFISIAIVIAFVLIGYLDSDTNQMSDLFEVGDILGLVVYFVPTLLVTISLFRHFNKKGSMAASITKALVLGIPVCFTAVIVVLITLKLLGSL